MQSSKQAHNLIENCQLCFMLDEMESYGKKDYAYMHFGLATLITLHRKLHVLIPESRQSLKTT